jgi:TolC family type I secretion outer membrane protein
MKTVVLAALGASLLWLGPRAPAAQTLEDALVSAYLTNPQLEAQRAALRSADELVPQATSGWRPSLGINSSIVGSDIASSASDGQLGTIANSIFVDQSLYAGGEISANRRRADRVVRTERARLVAVEQEVLLDAVTVYTGLLADLAVLELAIQNENRLQRQLQAARDRFEVGEVTRTDVSQAEASVAGATSDRIRAEGQIDAARAAYRAVINQEPVNLAVPRPLAELPPNEAEAQSLAEVFNPNISAAQFNLAAAGADVDIANSALLPRLSLRGEFTYTEDPSLALDWQRVGSIGANLAVPLYQGGGEYARVRQSKEIVRQRRDDLEAVFRAVRREVTQSWQALQTATARIDAIEEQVRAAEIALEGTQQEALVGQRTVLDVLDQESTLFEAQVEFVRAQRDQILASYALKSAIGQLTAAGIGLPLEPYDPQAHYDEVRGKLFGLGGALDRD